MNTHHPTKNPLTGCFVETFLIYHVILKFLQFLAKHIYFPDAMQALLIENR